MILVSYVKICTISFESWTERLNEKLQLLVSVINECTILDVMICKDVVIFKTAVHLLYIVKFRIGVCVEY